MKILFFSDWRIQPIDIIHSILSKHHDIDLVLYGGDDVERFKNEQNKSIFEQFASRATYGFGGVLGNDCTEGNRWILNGKNTHDLHIASMKAGKYGVFGIEGAISHFNEKGRIVNNIGSVVHSDEFVSNHLKKQQKKTNVPLNRLIIVSHTPPYNCLDTGIRYGVEQLGSKTLRSFIENEQPRLVLSGHVHSQGGKVEKIGETVIVNAASDDQKMKKIQVAIITLKGNKTLVEWENLDDDLFGFSGIGSKRISFLTSLDITKLKELFALHDDIICNLNIGISKNTITQFRAQEQSRKEWETVRVHNKPFIIPEKCIFYDVETNLTQEPWMICAKSDNGDIFHQYELDYHKKNRRNMYKEFMEFIQKYPDHTLVSYSGCGFDKGAIRQGLSHNFPEALEEWEKRIQFDPISKIKQAFIMREDLNYGLKTISKLFGFDLYEKEKVKDIDGFEVGHTYEMYLSGKMKNFPLKKYKKYNEIDVHALEYTVLKLQEMNKGKEFDFYKWFDTSYLKNKGSMEFPNDKVKNYIEERMKNVKNKKTKESRATYQENLINFSQKFNITQRAVKTIGVEKIKLCQTEEEVKELLKNIPESVLKQEKTRNKYKQEVQELSEKLNVTKNMIKKIGVTNARICSTKEDVLKIWEEKKQP